MIGIILLLIVVAVFLIWFFNTSFGKRVIIRTKGTADELTTKDAFTVDGATAYYNAAISKKEIEYSEANTTYVTMVGKLEGFRQELRKLQKENMQLTININTCVDNNDDDGATTYLKKQETVEENMSILKANITELDKTVQLQKEAVDMLEKELADLKEEKKTQLFKLETAQTTAMLKKKATSKVSDNETDKMLEKVRDNVKKAQEEATGAQIAYEASTEVQTKRLDEKMKADNVNKKLEELKRQRKGN